MHPVIKHLLARKNKKHPFDDGRKIVAIFPGGAMTGVRCSAAVVALEELGLTYSFNSIYAISVGVPIALYFLAKQTRLSASICYETASKRFINILRPWKIVDIDYFINLLKEKKPLKPENVLSNPTELFVRLYDRDRKKTIYLEVHDIPGNEYMGLIKAAISIPFLHPGSTKIGNSHYKDPGFNKRYLIDHVKHVLNSDATDIVIIYNHLSQKMTVDKHLRFSKDRVFEIIPDPSWSLSRLETNKEKMKSELFRMGRYVKRTFGKDEGINLKAYENRD